MRKQEIMRKLLAALALLLALPCEGWADAGLGTRVPLPTAANQIAISSLTAPFNWQAVSVFNLSGTPGDYTTTFPGPLVVSPGGTSENGLTVKMPSGATGYAWRELSSTGTLLAYADSNGQVTSVNNGFVTGPYTYGPYGIYGPGSYIVLRTGPNASNVWTGYFSSLSSFGLGFPANTYGANPDTYLYRPASGALKTDGSLTAAQIRSGDGYTGTIPTTAQSLNLHGGIVTGFINAAGTQVGNP